MLSHIRAGDPAYYDLTAATVMDDHVHLILRPVLGVSLSRIMKGIKGVAARKVNKMRGTTGTLWQKEYFDRIVRDERELRQKLHYMLQNSVRRGLARDPWDYEGWYYYGMADEEHG